MVFQAKEFEKMVYKFVWNGELIRERTKQTNKRIAEQMEAAHKAALAKSEVGIRDKVQVPTFADFAAKDFRPLIDARFVERRIHSGCTEMEPRTFSRSTPWARQSSTQSRATKLRPISQADDKRGLQVARRPQRLRNDPTLRSPAS
jgi:hypothetical protein